MNKVLYFNIQQNFINKNASTQGMETRGQITSYLLLIVIFILIVLLVIWLVKSRWGAA